MTCQQRSTENQAVLSARFAMPCHTPDLVCMRLHLPAGSFQGAALYPMAARRCRPCTASPPAAPEQAHFHHEHRAKQRVRMTVNSAVAAGRLWPTETEAPAHAGARRLPAARRT